MDTNSHESVPPFGEGFARRSSRPIAGDAVCGRPLPSFVLMGVRLSSFVEDTPGARCDRIWNLTGHEESLASPLYVLSVARTSESISIGENRREPR